MGMPSVEVKRRHYHSVNEEVLDVVLCEGRGLAGTRHAVECVLPPGGEHPLTRSPALLFIHRVGVCHGQEGPD